MMSITSRQCRAARAMLGWSQGDLAEWSRVSKRAIADFESGNRQPQEATLTVLRQAFENGGVEFIKYGVLFRQEPDF